MKKGWDYKSLDSLCSVFTDGDWIESKDQSSKGIRLIQTGNIGTGYFKERDNKARYISEDTFKRLRCVEIVEGDCLISRLPDPIGRSCLIPKTNEKMITAVDCTIIRFNKNLLDSKYFCYYSQSFDYLIKLDSEAGGTTRKRISRSKLGEIIIPVPPLSEQQRIVGILDEAFEGIEKAKANAQRNLDNAREVFESYLNEVFSKRGEGWVEKTISEIAEHSLGKMLDKAKNKGVDQPYLRNFNVRWFEFDLSDLSSMPFLAKDVDRYSIWKNDVVICEGGYPGRAAIWNEDYSIYFQKALHRVRFKVPEYSKWFVYYLYLMEKTKRLKSHFSGTGIQHFTGEALGKFKIPVPPLQYIKITITNIKAISEECNNIESLYHRKLAALDELKQALLHRAFNGEL